MFEILDDMYYKVIFFTVDPLSIGQLTKLYSSWSSQVILSFNAQKVCDDASGILETVLLSTKINLNAFVAKNEKSCLYKEGAHILRVNSIANALEMVNKVTFLGTPSEQLRWNQCVL